MYITGLANNCASVIYSVAMLTMESEKSKSRILKEARRIIKKGGHYGIYELLLVPRDLTDDQKRGIQRELAKSMKVNARPRMSGGV